jgi:hypothetical protein
MIATPINTVVFVAWAVVLTGCSSGAANQAAETPEVATITPPSTELATTAPRDLEVRFPTVLDASASFDAQTETWAFAVTMSSPYDSPARYADGWRVRGSDGTVYGVHTLTHDHANEQPFTRRQSGVEIPETVDEVTIEGRDLAFGFGGTALTIDVTRA